MRGGGFWRGFWELFKSLKSVSSGDFSLLGFKFVLESRDSTAAAAAAADDDEGSLWVVGIAGRIG